MIIYNSIPRLGLRSFLIFYKNVLVFVLRPLGGSGDENVSLLKLT